MLGGMLSRATETAQLCGRGLLAPLALLLLLGPALPGCIVDVKIADDDETSGDGDGDPGDGDGDPGDGDGDPGDGDGDPGDGDGDPGDGDGDGDPGDGDGDPGACEAMDALQGAEDCALPVGWAWNGEACFEILCACEGSECDAVFEDQAACETAYAECLPDPACAALDAVGVGDCEAFFGYTWDGEACVGVSGCECSGDDCGSLFDEPAACEAAYAECTSGVCEADAAEGVGECDAFFGYAWDGQACVGISGCECVGLDCDGLPLEPADCEAAHASCG